MSRYAHLFNDHLDALCISQQDAVRLGKALRPKGKEWFTFNGGEIEGVYLARPEVVFHDREFEPKTPDPIHNAIRKVR
jgi:hypothetical protein